MGRRKSVYRVRRLSAESLPSPNATVPEITVELRVFYPPHMGHEPTAVRVLGEVANEATEELLNRWVADAEV